MNCVPLKFRPIGANQLIFSDDTGVFFLSNTDFLERYANSGLNQDDRQFLFKNGHVIDTTCPLSRTSLAYRWSQRIAASHRLDYVIVVPTLRCNLSCSYCQVSRAPEHASGFDMDDTTLRSTIDYLDKLPTDKLKLEFQGGEPLLRLDLLKSLRDFCRKRFPQSEFVVCTNLQELEAEHWEFLAEADTCISTSLDGNSVTHTAQRTSNPRLTDQFYNNLAKALEKLGASNVSALPTIDIRSPPKVDELVEQYASRGLTSIYLRPVNYQGFARKGQSKDGNISTWNGYYREFLEYIVDYNERTDSHIEEYYFSHILRRILQPGVDGHVDIRNPNLVVSSYILINYDGTLFPSDEARMLHRIGHADFSVGHISQGIDQDRVSALNANSANNFDADCIHCAYQPYCGTDIVDDISRYGRVDLPRELTWFCRRHLHVFDTAFEFLYSNDRATRHSIAKWLGIGSLNSHLIPTWP